MAIGLLIIGLLWSGAPDSSAYRWAEYDEAIGKAIAWVDGLQVDPAALQERGIKGKKLAEAIALYSFVLRYEDDPDEVRRFRSRILELEQH